MYTRGQIFSKISWALRTGRYWKVRKDYGVSHLAEMHKYIFQDIYGWAGKFRTINMEKEEPALGGLSIEYSDSTRIADDLFRALN